MFHVELAPLGGIFGPLKSDLGVFWPFRGTDFIMGKNQNANFSKSPLCQILEFFVVICEVILQKKGTNLSTGQFFSVFTLISHCDLNQGKMPTIISLERSHCKTFAFQMFLLSFDWPIKS